VKVQPLQLGNPAAYAPPVDVEADHTHVPIVVDTQPGAVAGV
jgi:hypothetical protein